MHHLNWCKAPFGWEVCQLLERHLSHCYVVPQLVHRPLLQGRHQLLVHLQLLRRDMLLVDQQLRLILHQVDEQHLQLRMCLVHHLQEQA